jgi:hypothetical protein
MGEARPSQGFHLQALHEEGLAEIRRKYVVESLTEDEPLPGRELLARIADKDAVLGRFYSKIDTDRIRFGPGVRRASA